MTLTTKNCDDKIISGAFRIRKPEQHFSPSGQEYVSCILESNFRSIKAYARLNTYKGVPLTHDHQLIRGKLLVRSTNGNKYANLIYAEPLVLEKHRIIDLLPYWNQSAQSHIVRLHKITYSLTSPSLFAFINNALSDQDNLLKYLSAPASINHHHNQPGGLLEHSTEVATIVSRHTEFPREMLEIAMVAALFHDIGKIKMMTADMRYTSINYLIRHEDLTLEILSESLKALDNEDPDTAIALRYLLNWSPTKEARPKITVAETLRSADRISSGLNAEIKAFKNHPNHHKFATLKCPGPKSHFWRLNTPQYQS
jgi:3'-5' exoribonuclease